MNIKTNKSPHTLEKKTFALQVHDVCEIKGEDDKPQRMIKGYASTFGNIDAYGDTIEKGAFTKTLQEKNRGRKVKFLYQHQYDKVIGVPTTIKEDEKGLYFEAMFADTPLADEAYKLAKLGALDGFSIGYRTIKAEGAMEGDSYNRKLLEVELAEVSLVTFEADTYAKVTDVKTAAHDARLAGLLLNLGYSQEQVTAAIKSLSLVDAEPENPHSAEQADKAPHNGDDVVSRKAQELLHSLRNLKQNLNKGS